MCGPERIHIQWFLFWAAVVIFKELIFKFLCWEGMMVLKKLILTISTLGGCGGLEETDS